MSSELDGVELLEAKAADVRSRLDPSTREAHVGAAVTALREKFAKDYGAAPPAAMTAEVEGTTGAAYDTAVWSDLESLKEVVEAYSASLARDIVAAEELPDAVTEAEREKGNALTFEQRHAVLSLDQQRQQNLRADISGGGFVRVLAVYLAAVATNDRPTLRFLERQRKLGWPGVVRDGSEVDAELETERLVTATRAGRVASDQRAAQARAAKVWSLSLDAIHRTWKGRGLHMVSR
jgi:hypothetical protein